MKIGICGMSGVGKGEFIKKLTFALEKEGITYKVYKEDSDNELFEISKKKNDTFYLNQIKRSASIIARDVKAYNEVDKPQVQIMDRVTSEVLFYNAVFLSNIQFRKAKPFLKYLYEIHREEIMYDYIICLTASDDVILERLEKRGEVLDKEMIRKYKHVNGYYINKKGINVTAKDFYFLDNVDFELMDKKMNFIVNDIKKILFDN